ncbi:MAG TPA: carboxypeptidase-like regulatory domain-containing protein, partial [Gemmatimonadales bacterium]|nr:carboxypeptidase-like regulatory domain-containing protein [Gemmatimonadales bacterium]
MTGTARKARRGSLSLALTFAFACCAGALPARAQVASGEITGVVKDSTGDAVPGATVTITDRRTNLQRVAVSSEDGVYTAASLPPGEYRLDIELSGFRPVRREGVRLSTGEKARIDFELGVGGVEERVTVVGD